MNLNFEREEIIRERADKENFINGILQLEEELNIKPIIDNYSEGCRTYHSNTGSMLEKLLTKLDNSLVELSERTDMAIINIYNNKRVTISFFDGYEQIDTEITIIKNAGLKDIQMVLYSLDFQSENYREEGYISMEEKIERLLAIEDNSNLIGSYGRYGILREYKVKATEKIKEILNKITRNHYKDKKYIEIDLFVFSIENDLDIQVRSYIKGEQNQIVSCISTEGDWEFIKLILDNSITI